MPAILRRLKSAIRTRTAGAAPAGTHKTTETRNNSDANVWQQQRGRGREEVDIWNALARAARILEDYVNTGKPGRRNGGGIEEWNISVNSGVDSFLAIIHSAAGEYLFVYKDGNRNMFSGNYGSFQGLMRVQKPGSIPAVKGLDPKITCAYDAVREIVGRHRSVDFYASRGLASTPDPLTKRTEMIVREVLAPIAVTGKCI